MVVGGAGGSGVVFWLRMKKKREREGGPAETFGGSSGLAIVWPELWDRKPVWIDRRCRGGCRGGCQVLSGSGAAEEGDSQRLRQAGRSWRDWGWGLGMGAGDGRR